MIKYTDAMSKQTKVSIYINMTLPNLGKTMRYSVLH